MAQTLEETQQQLPFAAVVEQAEAKQALLLLAIDPRLGGLALSAQPGTAKTTLARSFHALLPTQLTIAGCASQCNPVRSATWCSHCRKTYYGQVPEIVPSYPAFINLPLNITEDRLLGGLALEATLQQGQRVAERGVLAEANRGVLYCDQLNRLEVSTCNYLMDSLSRGWLVLEREGLSAEYPADFMLIGTFDAQEGALRPGLLDRLGLIVCASHLDKPLSRVEVMRRVLNFDQQPTELAAEYAADTRLLRQRIVQGRELLPQVQISDEQLLTLAEIAGRLAVLSNRADLLAVRAARAAAALAGRLVVLEEDLKLAVQLVLLPRATRLPEPESEPPQDSPPPPPPPNQNQPTQEPENNNTKTNEAAAPEQPPPVEDLLLAALETKIPEDILALLQARQTRAKSGSRGETFNWKRGRYLRSRPNQPGQGHGRIAILDTLRAAAPFQTRRGRTVEANQALLDSSVGPELEENKPNSSIQLRATDLRWKQYKDKAGVLFIFVVDASGSMALNRMREAKGAVTQLLQQAYVHRDKVALIAFRGTAAQILLPASQSVELAKRSLDVLPVGGGTPLAAALLAGLKLSQQASRQGIHKTMLVLITDGRGNVLLKEDALTGGLSKEARKSQTAQEVQKLASTIAATGITAVVLDTQINFLSKGTAAQLARTLNAHYVYLPQAEAGAIAANVIKAAETLR